MNPTTAEAVAAAESIEQLAPKIGEARAVIQRHLADVARRAFATAGTPAISDVTAVINMATIDAQIAGLLAAHGLQSVLAVRNATPRTGFAAELRAKLEALDDRGVTRRASDD